MTIEELGAAAKRVDNLISSVARIYFALASLTFLYVYLGWSQANHTKELRALVALDRLTAIRSIALRTANGSSPLQYSDLPKYFDAASDEFSEFVLPSGQLINEETRNQRFPRLLAAGAAMHTSVPMRTQILASCNVAVFHALPGGWIQTATFMIVGEILNIKTEDISLVAIDRECGTGPPSEFLGFILRDGERIALALPQSVQQDFPLLAPGPFHHFPFGVDDLLVLLGRLPPYLRTYVELRENYDVIHLKAVEARILSYAARRLGRFFNLSELEEAIARLYERRVETTPFFGVTVDRELVLKLGPIILWVLTFELWRRLRRLPSARIGSDEPWFVFDADDAVGKVVGYSLALFPAVASALIYLMFVHGQSLGLIVGGKVIGPEGLIAWNFPEARGPGWTPRDHWTLALLVILPLHVAVIYQISKKVIALINANTGYSLRNSSSAAASRLLVVFHSVLARVFAFRPANQDRRNGKSE